MANSPVNYNYNEIIAFPSSNATDQGVQYTEGNTQRTVLRITEMNYTRTMNDFVPRRTASAPYKVNLYPHYDIKAEELVDDRPGLANIKGYAVKVMPGAVIQTGLPQPDEISTQTTLSPGDSEYLKNYEEHVGYAYLCLEVIFDQNKNLRGDDFVSGSKKMMGIQLMYYSGAYYREHKDVLLLLGWVNEDGSDIIDNEDKVSRIDPDTIVLKIDGDPVRDPWDEPFPSYPPRQTATLTTEYVNNLMKGYYVSKGGDNEYGDVTFREKPEVYDDPKFNWKTQDRTSNNFAARIVRDSVNKGLIVVKDHDDSATSFTTVRTPNKYGFYQGMYKGNVQTTEAEVEYSTGLSTAVFSTNRLLKINNTDGAIRLTQRRDATGTNKSMFGLESVKAGQSHNGVEAGNVIWGTNNVGDVGDTDDSTRYVGNINYLLDSSGFIKSVQGTAANPKANTITLVNSSMVNQIQVEGYLANSPQPSVLLKKPSVQGSLTLSTTNTASFKNAIELKDNLVVKSNGSLGGHIQAEGFIYCGTKADPTSSAQVSVPEFTSNDVNGNPQYLQRALRPGDIYGTQVWSAVYNDLAEMFEVSEDEVIKPGDVLACSTTGNYYTKVSKDNYKSAIGVVTDNAGFILGGFDTSKRHIPVALAGRVWVTLPEGLDFEKGDWVYVNEDGELSLSEIKHERALGMIVELDNETRVRILVK